MTDYSNPRSLGSRFRSRRLGPLKQMITRTYAEKGTVTILDVGGRKLYWNLLDRKFLESHRVRITILNIPGDLQGENDEVFTHVIGNACLMPEHVNRSFDIAHSNSVIEHVGGWANIKAFASEIRRVANRLFIQTPYYWFPIEPHFVFPCFHWLPRPIQESLVINHRLGQRGRALNLDSAIQQIEEAPRLLDFRTYRLLFPDCEILKERILFFTKSMIAVRR